MKITGPDYQILSRFVGTTLRDHPGSHRDYQDFDRTPRRFRFDVLYASGMRIGDGVGMDGDADLYAYMDDDHIDTALRSIMRENGFEWAAGVEDPKDAIKRKAYEFTLRGVSRSEKSEPFVVVQAEVLAISSELAKEKVLNQFWYQGDYPFDIYPEVEIIAETEIGGGHDG